MLVSISTNFTSTLSGKDQVEGVHKYMDITSQKIHAGKQPTDSSFHLTLRGTAETIY